MRRPRTSFQVGPKRTTLSISVPPRQAIAAGWRLLRLGIWYWLRRRDAWISAELHGK